MEEGSSLFLKKCALFAIVLVSGIAVLSPKASLGATSALVDSPFKYNFYVSDVLEEIGSLLNSSSPYWWVNSGGQLVMKDGRGMTMQGNAPVGSKWRTLYAISSNTDTDGGLHPQNLFRLVGRSKWKDFTQQIYFKIVRDNLSDSPNRNASNGLLLFNRYQDGDNLYYTGLRVDGTAVIKKKKNGSYYTLAQKKIFSGSYDEDNNPNLLPKDTWLGVRSKVYNNSDGSTSIHLYMDKNWNGRWTEILSAVDDGRSYGGSPISGEGYGGVRTDFMDVIFDQYNIVEL